jgi:hypothetical protein
MDWCINIIKYIIIIITIIYLFIYLFIYTLFSLISSYSSDFLACANFVIGLWAVMFCT